jgi:hypothetical protein
VSLQVGQAVLTFARMAQPIFAARQKLRDDIGSSDHIKPTAHELL